MSAEDELARTARELREFALSHPWDLAGPLPDEYRRDLVVAGRTVRVQFSYVEKGLMPRLLGHSFAQLSVSPRDERGALPAELVAAIRDAFFSPEERPDEVPSELYPGLVRQFMALDPQAPEGRDSA